MASRPVRKMDIAERAKQFMPFAALKGLPEALAERERTAVPRAELSEDMAADLDRRMQAVERGCMLTVIYFHEGEYRRVTGQVVRIDKDSRTLQVADTRIAFEDILDVS